MKKIRTIALVIVAMCVNSAFASGRLTLQQIKFTDDSKLRPMMGLSIDERVFAKLYVNSWVGFGSKPQAEGFSELKEWSTVKLGLDYRFAGFSIGAGTFAHADWSMNFFSPNESGYYAKISMKLW